MDESPGADAEKEEDPIISLNVITGLSSADMMQLNVCGEEDTLMALVDSGSTHSIISIVAAS
jgi:hypothetical protein